MAGLIPFNKYFGRPAVFEEFYNMLDDLFNDTRFPKRRWAGDTFKLDVQETDKEYVIEAELPGARKEDISVEYNEGRLTIAFNREESVDEERKNYIHKERRYQSMQRSLYLPDTNADGIKAKLENGILLINVPKQPTAGSSYKIDVE